MRKARARSASLVSFKQERLSVLWPSSWQQPVHLHQLLLQHLQERQLPFGICKVESCNLLSLLNLLLIALDLALKLVDKSLHALMVLLIFITSKCELLNSALRLAEILADISIASAFSIQFRFQLSDAGFHLNHGLSTSLQCIDLSFISTSSSILALGFKELLVLFKIHCNILLTTEFICKTCSIDHCSGSLFL